MRALCSCALRAGMAVQIAAIAAHGVRAAPAGGQTVTCGSCHNKEAQSQPKTAMGVGIEVSPNQELLRQHPRLTMDANGYHYEITYKNGASTYTVTDGAGALSLPIRYAFGVHNQTFVLEYQGRFYESLATYYSSTGALGITVGDDKIRPRNLTEAMGRETGNEEITACFNCHGTGGVHGEKLKLDALQPGLNCEHCHTGADTHMRAMSGGRQTPVPRKLGEMAAEEMANFCGECHRTWASVVGQHLFGKIDVRFQPYRLASSRCFLGDDKRIRCTACHDPHTDLIREDSTYDRVCLSCHDGKAVTSAGMTPKICPTAGKQCVSCHMPKVQLPGSPEFFTDHEIRIAHPGDPYPD
ncbi:MAG: multiheme c-type cytochrome [Bryobacteraceae bacterium]|jgi:cytochrome c554/c'-like protein